MKRNKDLYVKCEQKFVPGHDDALGKYAEYGVAEYGAEYGVPNHPDAETHADRSNTLRTDFC